MVPALTLAVIAAIVVTVVVAYLAWVVLANRRAGTGGLVRRVLLTCPSCRGSFEYAMVPGASVSSLRLGTRRYMSCPLCHRWSVIRVAGAPLVPPLNEPSTAPPLDP